MGTRQFAVCDNDREYLRMFQAYLQKQNPADYEIVVFDTVNQALAASCENAFEILLVGEKIYDKNVIKIKATKVFILQEDGLSGITQYSMIAKYQSMEKLIAQVLDEFALDDSFNSVGRCGKNKTSLLSFYAPDRQKGQSAAALGAAQVLADMGNKVLYINLLPFTGFEELLRTSYESDVTDFLYFVLNHSDKLLYKLNSIKQCVHGVDYLPPVLDYADLLHISGQDWERMMDTLLYSSDYTHIVMDLSETCQGFYHILGRSDRIYLLTDCDTPYGRAMLSHYKKLLKEKDYGVLLDNSIEFSLPSGWEHHGERLENISVSPVGVCMKGVLDMCGMCEK
ncbi:MAG: hypothetical protein J6D08_08455 [Lachnospiraceae bacterium]|nr:hypothetical protein [Lachnospiraceae bacterium]